jgi:hypothetical protein
MFRLVEEPFVIQVKDEGTRLLFKLSINQEGGENTGPIHVTHFSAAPGSAKMMDHEGDEIVELQSGLNRLRVIGLHSKKMFHDLFVADEAPIAANVGRHA